MKRSTIPSLVRVLLIATLVAGAAPAQVLDTVPLTSRRDLERYRALLGRLETSRIDVDWKETTLGEAVGDLRRQLRVNFVVTPAAREAAADETYTLRLRRVPAVAVVGLLARDDRVALQHRHGVVYVTTPADAVRSAAVLRIYSMHDLLYVPPDFPGPRLGLRPGPIVEPEVEVRERESRDPEEIVDLIRAATGERLWEIEGVSIRAAGRSLIVRHTPAVQRRVRRMLAALGAIG